MERPILFSGPMVRAILEGRKTQTRRVVKSPARNMQESGMVCIDKIDKGDRQWHMRLKSGAWNEYTHDAFMQLCPYGRVGDRLWVRETWAAIPMRELFSGERSTHIEYRAGHIVSTPKFDGTPIDEWPTRLAEPTYTPEKWRPSIHMPRWASRITLEITDIQVQLLQEISNEDAIAEGVSGGSYMRDQGLSVAQLFFADLWDSINEKRGFGWDKNPWVWAISFKRTEATCTDSR